MTVEKGCCTAWEKVDRLDTAVERFWMDECHGGSCATTAATTGASAYLDWLARRYVPEDSRSEEIAIRASNGG